MITQERMEQFFYLLSQLLKFSKSGLSVRDAGICAFFSTAEKFDKKEPTIRDMVTRSCGANIDIFYGVIQSLFAGDAIQFKNKYYIYIPKNMHREMDITCSHFTTSGITPPDESPNNFTRLLKEFTKSSPDQKRIIIKAVSVNIKNFEN